VSLLLPGLLAAALLSFIESLLSFVVGMPTIQTLPMLLWAYLRGRSAILSYAAVVPWRWSRPCSSWSSWSGS
jgi:ABC-type spermidine/putrescine transport system permease subunit II